MSSGPVQDSKYKDGVKLPQISPEELFRNQTANTPIRDAGISLQVELSVMAAGYSTDRAVFDSLVATLTDSEYASVIEENQKQLQKMTEASPVYIAACLELIDCALEKGVHRGVEESLQKLGGLAMLEAEMGLLARADMLMGEHRRYSAADYGDLADAHERYRAALNGADREDPADRLVILRSLSGIANTLSQLNNDEDALSKLEEAVKLSERVSCLSSAESMRSLMELGYLAYEEGRLDLSEKIFLNILREMKQAKRLESWDGANALSALASVNEQAGKADVAIPCMRRVIEFLEAHPDGEPRRGYLLKATKKELLKLAKELSDERAVAEKSEKRPSGAV